MKNQKQPRKSFMTSVNEIMGHLQKGKTVTLPTGWNERPTTLSVSTWTGSWNGYGEKRLSSSNYGTASGPFTMRQLKSFVRSSQATRDPKDPNKLIDSKSRKPVKYTVNK